MASNRVHVETVDLHHQINNITVTIMTKLLIYFMTLLMLAMLIVSCDSENSCDTSCGTDQIQGLDCTCFPQNPPDCPGISCPTGEILTVDCSCISPDSGLPCGGTCPDGFSCVNEECVQTSGFAATKSGRIAADETWAANTVYTIAGKVVINDGVTLTIEPGTIIKGAAGTGTLASALIIERGGKIMAEGTADAPIIMTAADDNITMGQLVGTNLDETQRGQWGGVIILGKAPISSRSSAEALIEGLPPDDSFGTYGGDDPADNSGVLRYVSIRHAGTLIGEGNEINGLTLGGVGSGTIIEHIEVVANLDDGIECFGGTVDITNALVWAQGDDAYDIDQAYAGTINNYIYIAGVDSDHGLEIDGPEGDVNTEGSFTMINGTLKGLASEYADFRSVAQGNVLDSYWFNFPAGADIELDDAAVSANYTSGLIQIKGNEFTLADGTSLSDVSADKGGDDAAFDTQFASDNSTVAIGANTKGADTSVFGWTMASQLGALDF